MRSKTNEAQFTKENHLLGCGGYSGSWLDFLRGTPDHAVYIRILHTPFTDDLGGAGFDRICGALRGSDFNRQEILTTLSPVPTRTCLAGSRFSGEREPGKKPGFFYEG